MCECSGAGSEQYTNIKHSLWQWNDIDICLLQNSCETIIGTNANYCV